ncbi:hypothetical protein AAFF_G00138160 [Aldrovandia affinis]|uniref:Secreted protein n=1 Tax=Aldrovandia affinis TaxID=143900 RepID=A0AAD7X2J8_9TELE|nr:hypothetical protein AAFF_G00138160 [Aldrovandia affinis]
MLCLVCPALSLLCRCHGDSALSGYGLLCNKIRRRLSLKDNAQQKKKQRWKPMQTVRGGDRDVPFLAGPNM